MSIHHLQYLDRSAYVSSIATLQDPKSVKFATMSLDWWDEQINWQSNGCVALCDESNVHLCYIFFTMDQYRMYLTIHNIFTPMQMRRHGYAHELLNEIFDIAIEKKVKRFKLSSISNSLDFYLALGFVYWGLNSVGDYYCDLPMPMKGLSSLDTMVTEADTATLMGKNRDKIYKKIHGNNLNLNEIQLKTYENDKVKMGKRFMLSFLIDKKCSI